MDVIKTQQMSASMIEKVVVHPLVLRNIVDNHNRLVKDSGKRVVGALLGSISRGIVGVTNSYAVPFNEDDKDPSIWCFNSHHLEYMLDSFKGLNGMENVVGWYSTCPYLRDNDLAVHSSVFKGCSYVLSPIVLVTIDVRSLELGIPATAKAYYTVDSSLGSGKEAFLHVSTEIAPPEVGGRLLVTEMTPGGDNDAVESIEALYRFVQKKVRISVSGYDTSLNVLDLLGSLEKHFESCGSVENIDVPIHPVTHAITDRCSTVCLLGEGAAEKALALNGSDAGGWIVSVALLPPECKEMAAGMSAREFALSIVELGNKILGLTK
ncbi:unnamed protein product [Eruca vesicaria subsp. sativa]|uniref:MPN domain-containing protein n=1 Tax=Eruca vesicaria subsp. sativa TaxID=29727 RepID=A0ABC8LE57_ERUVS|nr:unnamed protein product [Eruca vesicaria subsp. sativa]